MSCHHNAPNGEKSLLYQSLEQHFGPDKAHDIWTQVRSQEFFNKFGDWTKAPSKLELDDRGELTLFEVQKALNLTFPEAPAARTVVSREFGEPGEATLESVQEDILKFYAEAAANPDKTYFVPYPVGNLRKRYSNNRNPQEMANLLDMEGIPENVQFHPTMTRLMQNTYRRIVAGFGEQYPPELIDRDDQRVLKASQELLIPKKGGGFYSPQEQKEIIDTTVATIERLYRSNPKLQGNAVIAAFERYQKAMTDFQGNGDSRAEHMEAIMTDRVRIAREALFQLEGMGLVLSPRTVQRVLTSVETMERIPDPETFRDPEVGEDGYVDPTSDDFVEKQGRIAKDWSEDTFELDPKDTASARIKMYLGTRFEIDRGSFTVGQSGVQLPYLGTVDSLTDAQLQRMAKLVQRKQLWYGNEEDSEALRARLEEKFPRLPVENFLGLPRKADYERIFQDILLTLGDKAQNSSFEDLMSLLEQHYDPTIQQIAADLRQQGQDVQNEFRTVMMKQYQPFTMTTFSVTRNPFSGTEEWSLKVLDANRATQHAVLIKQWQEQQKLSDITIEGPGGARTLDIQRIRDRWLPILERARKTLDWSKADNRKAFITNFGNVLRVSGISVTDGMMADLFDNAKKWTGGSVASMFGFNKSGQPTGLFSIFIMRAAGELNLHEESPLEEAIARSQENNPLYNETSIMRTLAKLVAKHTPVTYSDNHRNVDGKSVYDWGLNTKLSHQFRSFVQNPETFDAAIEATDFSRGNFLSEYLANNPGARAQMQLSYLDGMRADWASEGRNRQSMSDREQHLLSVLLFQNSGHGFNKTARVHYLSLTHSDKTTTPVFKNMPRIKMGADGALEPGVVDGPDSAFYKLFKSEYDRITKQAGTVSGNRSYDKGKHLFYVLPHFNYEVMQGMVHDGTITQQEFESIWVAGKRNLTSVLNADNQGKVVTKVLEKVVIDLINNTLNTWKANGIVSETGNMFDKGYVRQLLKMNGIRDGKGSTSAVQYVGADNRLMPIPVVNETLARTAAKDYALNHFLFNAAQMQLFYGDPAEAYKGKEGTSELEQVQATMAEYAKRLAKDIAPRNDLSWGEKKTYRSLTLADVKVKEKYLAEIAELKRQYVDSTTNSTDAQEVTTVQEHLDVLYAAGKIPPATYTRMSGVIQKARGGYYAFEHPEDVAIIMQPQKPIYAHRGEPTGGTMLTDYVKSSSYPLYPPFTAGREIDGLRKIMEGETGNDIQRADFESARKLGNPTTPLTVLDAEGRFTNPFDTAVQAALKTMHRDGFGLQQEVPFDADKEAIKTITQMNENLTEGISSLEGFELPGHGTLSGKEVKALKETVRKKMLQHNLDALAKKLGIDGDGKISRPKVLQEIIRAMKTDTRGSYTLNDMQSVLLTGDDRQLLWPLTFNAAAPKIESLLMGMINKVVEVKMPGKSYVQASSTGYRFVDSTHADLSKVIRVGDYDGGSLQAMRPDPKDSSKILPGQVILPWNFFDAQGNKLKVEDFLITDEAGRKVLDPERVPKELLQLVGARIPNQKHSSMHPLEVVGFVPENMGDIVLIPAALVKQMGGDFDVDKLYTYKRPYVYDEVTKSFTAVTRTEGEAESFEHLQADYFNVHWAVLTHKDMLTKVLAPLDKNDLVKESALLKPPVQGIKLFADPMAQLDDFQRGKEAKRLVGMTSWAVKYSARIQDKSLRYGKYEVAFDNERPYMTEVPDSIQLKDEHGGSIREVGRLSGTGVSHYTEKDGGETSEATQRSKSDNHVMVQSESVDNAKNRTLDNLNLTTETYKAVQALIELQTDDGWAPNSKYWTRLITQPIIWEFSRMMREGNDSFSTEYNPDLFQSVYAKLRSQYESKLLGAAVDTSIVFDPQLLLEAQTKMQVTDEVKFAQHQIAALDLFARLYQIGTRMLEHESLFSQDVSGAGKDLLSVMDKKRRFETFDGPPILNAFDLYADASGEHTEAGFTFETAVGTAESVVSQVLPYDRLQKTFEHLAGIGDRKTLSMDTQRAVLKAFRSMAYSAAPRWWSDPQKERARLLYGENSLAKRLMTAKRTWGERNPFLNRLFTEIGELTTAPDFISYNAASKVATADKQSLTTGWLHLLLSTNLEQRTLGEDLLRYAMLTGGIQDARSFVEFAPTAYLAETTLAAHLRSLEDTLRQSEHYENPALIVQFLQHNPQTAFQVKQDLFGPMEEGRDYPESFEVPNDTRVQTDGGIRPFISYRSKTDGTWILYQHQLIGATDVYTRIDTLGNKGTDEYNGLSTGPQRSLFSENRSLAESTGAWNAQSELSNLRHAISGELAENSTHFEQLGIYAGTSETAIHNALNNIRSATQLPEYQRTVAAFLQAADSNGAHALAFQYYQAIGYDNVTWNPGVSMEGLGGFTGMALPDGSIRLNPKATVSLEDAADTLLHETVHQRLQAIVMAAGYDTKAVSTENITEHARFTQDFAKQFPEAVQHLRALDNLRYEAYTALRSRLGELRFAQVRAEVEGGQEHTSEEHTLYYGLHNMQEFTAHVLTNRAMAGFLNSVETREAKSFLEKIWSAITAVLEAFGKALGVQVKDGSILKEAISRVMALSSLENKVSLGDLTSPLLTETTLPVASEQQARDLENLYRHTYDRIVTTGTDGLGWSVLVQGKRPTAPVTQVDKVVSKLYRQLGEISKAIGNIPTEDLARRVPLQTQYIAVEEQIALLQRKNDIRETVGIAREQLRWVDQVLANPSASLSDIQLAITTTELWEGIKKLLYGDQTVVDSLDGFKEIQSEAEDRRIMLLNAASVPALQGIFKKRLNADLSTEEFRKNLEDIHAISANALALTRAKPMLVNATASLGWQAANNRDEELGTVVRRLQTLEKDLKDAGLTDSMLVEQDPETGLWGLVNRLSGKWHMFTKGSRSTLRGALKALDEAEITDETRNEKKRALWNEYWKKLQEASVFVSIPEFFDPETGTQLSGIDGVLQDLAERVGSMEYAEELVAQAQERYQAFIARRQAYETWVEDHAVLADEEKEGKDEAAQAALLARHKKEMLDKWTQHNSPTKLLEQLEAGKNVAFNSEGDRWLVMAPKAGKSEYWNDKFATITDNKAKKAVYNEYRAILQEMISYLPPDVQLRLPDNFLPIIPKGAASSLATLLAKAKSWNNDVLEAVTATDLEAALRARPDQIPVMYLKPTGHTKDFENRSTDLVRVLEIFSMMALQHKHMGPVLDAINIAESIMRDVNTRRLQGQEDGKPLRHVIDALKYFKDRLVFKKPHELEGKIDSALYKLNPVKQAAVRKEVNELIKEREELEQKMINDPMLMVIEEGPEQKRIDAINARLTEIERSARYIYASKITDALISINQMKALGYNPFSAVTNLTFGLISVSVMANGRTDIDNKTMRDAAGVMMHSVLKYATFTEGDATARKVNAVMERVGIMGDIVDTDYGTSNLKSRKRSKILDAFGPFNWQKSGDYFTKGILTIGMLKKKQVTAVRVGTGEVITASLWDVLDEHGQWDTTRFEANEDWSSSDINRQLEWNQFRDRIRKTGIIAFGNQDKNSPLMAKNSWLGRLAGQFRLSWLPEGFANRWMGEYHDINLQRAVKGRWRTGQDLGIANYIVVLSRQLLSSLPGVKHNPFEGITVKTADGKHKPLSESAIDMENMRRNFAGLAYTAAVTAAILMIEGFANDEHKKGAKERRRQLLINMLLRSQQDLMLYSSPSVFNTVSGNLLPASQVVVDYWKAVQATGHYFFGDTEHDRHAFDSWVRKVTRAGLPHPTFTLYTKTETMMTRDIDKISR